MYIYIYTYVSIYILLLPGLLDHSHGIDIPLHLRPKIFRDTYIFEGYKQIFLRLFCIYTIYKLH
jgi:hypothetical protein